MLTALSIENVVLIESQSLQLGSGLTVFTGETGAGKSIMLNALNLVLGKRADVKLIRANQDKASVIAHFTPTTAATALLEEHDIPCGDGELIIRRSLASNGKSKAFVNDIPATSQFLQLLAQNLVEMHGQHAQQGLLKPSNHRIILDKVGGYPTLLSNVASAYYDWQSAVKQRDALRAETAKAKEEEEYLQHVAQELATLNPQAGEEELLAAERSRMMQADHLRDGLQDALAYFAHDPSPSALLVKVERTLARLPEDVANSLSTAFTALESAHHHIEEAQQTLEGTLRALDNDPAILEQTEERLFALRAAARKHQITCDELPDIRRSIEEKLQLCQSSEEALSQLETQCLQHAKTYNIFAAELSKERQKTAQWLEARLDSELSDLHMKGCSCQIQISPREEGLATEHGTDAIAFLVRTNPGTPFGAIHKIASGGELSRLMLAFHVVLADKYATPTMIFDEVDTGIGGATANAVGKRLHQLSANCQVLCITHQPQVASYGHHHHVISKDECGTAIAPLPPHARAEELARMLSGDVITDEARAAARQLMQAQQPPHAAA